MGFTRAIAALLVLLLPGVSAAVEVNLSMQQETKFDTNAQRSGDDETSDVSFRFIPYGRVGSDDGKFAWRLSYQPALEIFVRDSDDNFLSHFAGGEASYDITPRTELTALNNFSVVQALTEDDISSDNSTSNDTERDTIFRNRASLALRHIITSRWVSDTNVSHNWFEADRDNAVDSNSIAALQSFNYRLDGSNTIGVGGGATFQFFDNTDVQPGSDTQIYRVFGSWIRQFGETTNVLLRGGPAFIRTEQDSRTTTGIFGPENLGGNSDNRITFFAEANITQRWTDTLTSSVLYNRSEDTANGLGASTIADRVTFRTTWTPTDLWDLSIRGDFLNRESPSNLDQGGAGRSQSEEVESRRWTVAGRVARRLSRAITMAVTARYSDQDTENTTVGSGSFDNFVGILSFRYDFDPFRL